MATNDPNATEDIQADQVSITGTEPADCVNTNNADQEPRLNISFGETPSQQLQSLDSIFALGGQEYFLNNCGMKRLVVGITSTSMPNLQVVFKLHDLKNGWHVQFGKKTWDAIVQHEGQITDHLENFILDEVFDNNRIRVETTILYNTCCVQFIDVTETSITMMPPTFDRMISLKNEVENLYIELIKKKNDVAKRIKLFMDVTFFHLFKSNNIDNRHNYNWLTLYMNQSSNFLDLSNSIGSTWDKLGKWIADENNADPTNEP